MNNSKIPSKEELQVVLDFQHDENVRKMSNLLLFLSIRKYDVSSCRSSRSQMFSKIDVLQNHAMFIGKHLY